MSVRAYDCMRSGRARRAGWFVVPALVALAGTSGVTVRPLLGRLDAYEELEFARRRTRLHAAARLESERFEAAGGMSRLEAAREALEGMLPERVAPVEVSALCGLLAQRHGIALEGVKIGEPRETKHAVLADRVVALEAELAGHATLAAIASLAPELRSAGFPCAVVEAAIARREPGEPVFHFRVALELYRRAEPLPAELTATSDAEESRGEPE